MIEDPKELARQLGAWEDLAANAIDPNPFYEPWMLLPALETLASERRLALAQVYADSPAREQRLIGFFPLERVPKFKGMPVRTLRLLQHPYCYLCTPLVRRGYDRACLEGFFQWLAESSECDLLELRDVSGEGPFHHSLADHFWRHHSFFTSDRYTRALFRPQCDANAYLQAALNPKSRKELRRLARRLAERGRMEFRFLSPQDDVESWIQTFLALERRGWKGRAGTALASSLRSRSFFESIAREAFRRQRLAMLGLYLDGRAVALSCKLRAGDGVFAFKIAFDEAYDQYSPGLLLEVEHIVRLHEDPCGRWMDSCAVPDHQMANRIWLDRRAMETLVVAAGGLGGLIVSLVPLLRWTSRGLRGLASPKKA